MATWYVHWYPERGRTYPRGAGYRGAMSDGHPFTRDEFDRIYARVPRLTVEVVLTGPDGLLLARRDIEPCRGSWHLPGGTGWFGEPLTAAVRRVARREVGVDVRVGALLGYIEYPQMHAAGYPGWPVGVAFAATVTDGEIVGSAEGAEVRFHRRIPPGTIAEQAEFLARLPDGLRPVSR